MRRSMKILLIVSLLCNLLVIAMVGSMAVRFWWSGSWSVFGASSSGVRPHIISHIIDDLPLARQAEFTTRFALLRQKNKKQRRWIRQNREALREIFRAPEFDQTEYQRLTEAIQQAKQESETDFTQLLGDALVWMPADERRKLSRWLNREGYLKHGKKKRKHEG